MLAVGLSVSPRL
ncbi:L-2-hydroxyglutarate oxidase LhgO, partial [Vibrio cholerae HC-51A1]